MVSLCITHLKRWHTACETLYFYGIRFLIDTRQAALICLVANHRVRLTNKDIFHFIESYF